VSLVILIFDHEQEVEVVRLDIVLVISFADDAHYVANTFYLVDEGHLALKVKHTSNGNWLQEEDLVNTQEFRVAFLALKYRSDPRDFEGLSHEVAAEHLAVAIAILSVH